MGIGLLQRGELHQLASKFKTAKAHPAHDYLRAYEFFLSPFKDNEFTLMELGAGMAPRMGASFFMWEEYFPKAQIVGVDNKREASELAEGHDRLTIEVGDLGDLKFLEHLKSKYKPTIILDDASHRWSHQILAMEHLFDALMPGGVYICEDLHTSFGKLRNSYGDHKQDALNFILTLITLVCGDGEAHPFLTASEPSASQRALAEKMDFIGMYGHSAVIMKSASK